MALKPHLDKSKEEQLRAISPRLFFDWDRKRERWVVKEKSVDGRVFDVMWVEDANGERIPIDNRTFDKLRWSDNSKYRNKNEAYYRMKERREKIIRKKEELQEERNKDFAIEAKNVARGRKLFHMGARA
jgi:hypothetical protein